MGKGGGGFLGERYREPLRKMRNSAAAGDCPFAAWAGIPFLKIQKTRCPQLNFRMLAVCFANMGDTSRLGITPPRAGAKTRRHPPLLFKPGMLGNHFCPRAAQAAPRSNRNDLFPFH